MLYIQQKAANPKKHGFAAIIASQKGLEPPTFRLGGERSIQLSYRDKIRRAMRCMEMHSSFIIPQSGRKIKPGRPGCYQTGSSRSAVTSVDGWSSRPSMARSMA